MADRVADIDALESFIQSAPPGELGIVTSDIQNILSSEPDILENLSPAFRRYHEAQFAVVKLGKKGQTALVTPHNRLDDGRYIDPKTESVFEFDPVSKAVSDVQPHTLESQNNELIQSLYQAIKTVADNHHSSCSIGIYPTDDDSRIAIVSVANQYNSRNFWNGRWRSCYFFDPTDQSLSGTIQIDIHYFEDGNVRFVTEKQIKADELKSPISGSSVTPDQIANSIQAEEQHYHQSINKAFLNLSTGPLKNLRPKLPVTKQKIDWDKIAASKVGRELSQHDKTGR